MGGKTKPLLQVMTEVSDLILIITGDDRN